MLQCCKIITSEIQNVSGGKNKTERFLYVDSETKDVKIVFLNLHFGMYISDRRHGKCLFIILKYVVFFCQNSNF